MRTYADIQQMAAADYSIGLEAHYKPLANLIADRNYKHITEVGTAYGGNAYHMLSTTDIDYLICIDPFIYYPAMPGFICQEEYDTLYRFACDRIAGPKCEVWRMTGKEAIDHFGQRHIADLVFLDGSHDYEDVRWECENYSKIIRPGGVLAGHDYNIFEGVNKAVDEFSQMIGKPVQQLHGNIWHFNL